MSDPIKILHIIPSLSSGGAERQLTEVITGTSPEHFSHTVVTFNDSEFFAPPILKAGAEIIDLKIAGNRPWFLAASKINSLIKEKGAPDIINSWLYHANITARLVKLRNKKIPLVTSLQAPDFEPEVIKAGNWPPHRVAVLKMIDRLTASLAKPLYVACSHHVANSYRRQLGIDEKRMSVIYNCVVPESLKCEEGEPERVRESLNLPDDAFIFLHVGRLDPQKGQSFILEAFKKALPEMPGAYLIIAGAGVMDAPLKALAAELELGDRIQFLGRRKDVGALLEVADVFVFPSLSEGLPLALLEAMSKSLPSIVSDIGPFLEVVENEKSGLIVKAGNANLLAKAMLRTFRDEPLRNLLGPEAKKRVEEKFYGSVLMPEWEEYYRALATKKWS